MRRLLLWVASHLRAPRVILDIFGEPYLSRYYLLPWQRPRMPDGSEPFDEFGNPREGVVWPRALLPGVYLHHFHKGDTDRETHSHPWVWALSLILTGGYREERLVSSDGKRCRVTVRTVKPGMFNFIRATDFHRVDLLDGEAWSLFIVGPKTGGWGFKALDGTFTHWREFLARKQRAYYEISPEKFRP